MNSGKEDPVKSEVNDSSSRKSSNSSSYEYLSPESTDFDTKQSGKVTSPVLEYFAAEKDLHDAMSSTNKTCSPLTENVVGRSVFYSEKITTESSSEAGE